MMIKFSIFNFFEELTSNDVESELKNVEEEGDCMNQLIERGLEKHMRSEWEKVEDKDESELGIRFGIEPDWETVEEALGDINRC